MIFDLVRRRTKCEGRFPEIRDSLVEAIDVLLEEDSKYMFLRPGDLHQLTELFAEGELTYKDHADPYFGSKQDCLRADPAKIFSQNMDLAIIPLISTDAKIAQPLVIDYARAFGLTPAIRESLILYSKNVEETPDGVERLDLELGIDMSKIALPTKSDKSGFKNLAGYKMAAGFGIGKNKLETLAFDAPYHIEIHKVDSSKPKYDDRTPSSGALGIGFWINPEQEMLVSQIQSIRGQRLPEDVDPGVAALIVAEKVAMKMGFKSIITYSAKNHPQFNAHPETYQQLAKDFTCFYDRSAKVAGWEPLTRPCKDSNHENYAYRKLLQ